MKFKTYTMDSKQKYLENEYSLILEDNKQNRYLLCFFDGHISFLKTLIKDYQKDKICNDKELLDMAMYLHYKWIEENGDPCFYDTATRESVYCDLLYHLNYEFIFENDDVDNFLGIKNKVTGEWLEQNIGE